MSHIRELFYIVFEMNLYLTTNSLASRFSKLSIFFGFVETPTRQQRGNDSNDFRAADAATVSKTLCKM